MAVLIRTRANDSRYLDPANENGMEQSQITNKPNRVLRKSSNEVVEGGKDGSKWILEVVGSDNFPKIISKTHLQQSDLQKKATLE